MYLFYIILILKFLFMGILIGCYTYIILGITSTLSNVSYTLHLKNCKKIVTPYYQKIFIDSYESVTLQIIKYWHSMIEN